VTPNGQTQRAGQNSQQIQVSGDLVLHQGISEERAREIALQTARGVVAEFAYEGEALIQERIDELDQRVISGLSRAGTLDAFTDPAFQRTYKKAQSGAAASERPADYDMLAGLLKERADRPTERPIIAGIERAIEVVDLIDESSLRGLTVLNAVTSLSPNAPAAANGLDVLEELFAQVTDGLLPMGAEWMDHLDVLDALRVNSGTNFRPFDEFYPDHMHGYVCPGLSLGDVPDPTAPPYRDVHLAKILVEHDYKPGFVRPPASNENTLKYLLRSGGADEPTVEAVSAQSRTIAGFAGVDAIAATAFLAELQLRPTLARIREWWGQFPHYVQITAVGRTLARANAYRLDVSGTYPRD